MSFKVTVKSRDSPEAGVSCLISQVRSTFFSILGYNVNNSNFCLGFDLKQSTFQEVEYVNKRLQPKLNDEEQFTLPKHLQRRLHLLKASDWSYEEELRILIDLSTVDFEDPLYFSGFSQDMRLVEVILGERSDLSVLDIENLTDALKLSVYVSKARLERTGFRVVPDGNHLSSKLGL